MNYKIWKYFPVEAREEAVKAEYVTKKNTLVLRRTEDGYCPLGVAIKTIGEDEYSAPHGEAVVVFLCDYMAKEKNRKEPYSSRFRQTLWNQAIKFIRDWDRGKINSMKELNIL